MPGFYYGIKYAFVTRAHTGRGLFLLALLVAFISGCQTLAPMPELTAEQQAQRLATFPRWEAEGKIALRLANDNQSGFFKWTQLRENYVIHIFGPFGRGATWLRRTSHGVTLENAETGYRQADTPEALMEQVLGWQVPVSSLRYWMLGVADPNYPVEQLELDAQGFIRSVHQQGWSVEFQNPQRVQGMQLPGRIRAHREQMRVTVAVNRWNLN